MAKATTKKPTPPAAAAPASKLVVYDFEQGSEEWFRAHIGVPSASNFGTIMAVGQDGGKSLTRTDLMHRMAGEIITEMPAEETFKSAAMKRGKEMEAAAIADYEARKKVQVRRVGFGVNFDGLKRCGASPDGLVGFDGGLETKTMRPDLMIPKLLRGAPRIMAEHIPQVQGNIMVFEAEWWDFKIFWPRMPDFTVRVYRDDVYIKTLMNEIERFNFELKRLVEQIRKMGA